MEKDQDFLDKPSEERNTKKDQGGLDALLCTPMRTLEGNVFVLGLLAFSPRPIIYPRDFILGFIFPFSYIFRLFGFHF